MREVFIRYIGDDTEYWETLKEALKRYPDIEPNFVKHNVSDDFNVQSEFVDAHDNPCDIIYIDLSSTKEKGISLCKLLCRNNMTRLKSVVALSDYSMGEQWLLKSVLAGVRLNYYKGIELEDVVFHPLSLLDSGFRPLERYAEGKSLGDICLGQILRVGYVADDHFRVETNAPLETGEIVELDTHPLQGAMESRRFYVQDFQDSDIYYNQRFSYNLKYTYVDSPFFKESESSWLTLKKLEEKRTRSSGFSSKKELRYIQSDVEKRRKQLEPVREKVKKWVACNQSQFAPKKLKVLVVDETLEIFKQCQGNPDNFKYSINFQTRLTKDFYQIRRLKPHLIVFHYEEEGNNLSVLEDIAKQIKRVGKDYDPAIIVFNCPYASDELQKICGTEHVVSHQGGVNLEAIRKMSQILDQRFHITDTGGKLFLKTVDPRSVATLKREARILKFNESELYFESQLEIPMWTIFLLESPLKAMVTVLPFGPHSPKFSGNVYRALINGVGENERAHLRRLVNSSLTLKGRAK